MMFFEYKVIGGYVEKINLKVTATIAKPIFEVYYDDKIFGNYSNVSQIPEYTFEIRNYNEEGKTSEMSFNVNFETMSNNKLEYEIIDVSTNEIVLSNDKTNYEFILEKDNPKSNQYKILIKSNLEIVKDNLKIIVDAKYFRYEIDAFEINLDKRNLEYEISISDADKKYTNNSVLLQINCNKEIQAVSGFQLSEDKTCLIKTYDNNTNETITIKDYYNNEKNIQISINNIDKSFPEIVGIEEGALYDSGLKLIYKDNIGIRSIKIENTTKNQSYSTTFESEKTIIENEILVVDNKSLNPYYLNQGGNYTITVIDFAGNQTVKHIKVKRLDI